METGCGVRRMKSGCSRTWDSSGRNKAANDTRGDDIRSRDSRLQLSFDLCNPSNDHFTRLDASSLQSTEILFHRS